jgi:hypothetical protein
MDSYKRMHEGVVAGVELQRAMVGHLCNKALRARSLCSHLSSTHDIHQQVVVDDGLLEEWAGVRYSADSGEWKDPIQCPYPGCPGVLSSPYMLRRHFQDLHPKDTVEISREGTFPRCKHCTMQCNLQYLRHIHTHVGRQQACGFPKSISGAEDLVCLLGAEQWTQQDSAITAALALHKLLHVDGELLEKVDLFQYLGWILARTMMLSGK